MQHQSKFKAPHEYSQACHVHNKSMSATLWQVQRQVISTVKRFTAWSDGLPVAALVYPACYPIFPRAGHEPRNKSQGAGFKLKRREAGATELGDAGVQRGWERPTQPTLLYRTHSRAPGRLWSQSSLVTESVTTAHLPGQWWLTALNITLLCFTFVLSRYRAEVSIRLPSRTGYVHLRTQVVHSGGRSLRVVMVIAWQYLESCHIEGPETHPRCWGYFLERVR